MCDSRDYGKLCATLVQDTGWDGNQTVGALTLEPAQTTVIHHTASLTIDLPWNTLVRPQRMMHGVFPDREPGFYDD